MSPFQPPAPTPAGHPLPKLAPRLHLGRDMGFCAAVIAALILCSLYSFHLFHVLVELFSIIVACGIFMVAWNTRHVSQNYYITFLGIAYLWVGALDLMHTLTYSGLGAFPAAIGTDPPIQFWIAARYFEALSLLAATFVLGRRFNPAALLSVTGGIAGLIGLSIFSGVFPTCYIDGLGVTRFKMVSEFVIAGILLVTIGLVWRRRDRFHPQILRLMTWALGLTVVAELSFSFYIGLFGLFNQLGHYFKFLSFFLIYRATIQTSLREPYEIMFGDLQRSERALRETQRLGRIGGWELNLTSGKISWDEEISELYGKGPDFEPADLDQALAIFHPEDRPTLEAALAVTRQSGQPFDVTLRANTARGDEVWIHCRGKGVVSEEGRVVKIVGTAQDVTDRRLAELARERLIDELREALAHVKTLSGLLPICAHCKKVRDDEGYWQQIESYLSHRSEAEFSHSICPECAKQHYPEFYE